MSSIHSPNPSNRQGKITPNGVVLKTHENATVVFLTECGFNIDLIKKSNITGVHSPDFIMNGIAWEMKSPTGEGKYLISNTLQRAVKQSQNIVLDLRRTKRHLSKCLREIEKEFKKSTSIKQIIVITKSKKIIDYKK